MSGSNAVTNFRSARDLLIVLRDSPDDASAEFKWPELGHRFNWAVDWFDEIARGNNSTALTIVEEDGSRTVRTFDEMVTRSDQVASWLKNLGVACGDHVMVMLGNQVELWESMLAIMKLGAVVLPTATAAGTSDLIDRMDRGEVRHVIVASKDSARFTEVPGDFTKIAVGSAPAEWRDYSEAFRLESAPTGHPGTAPGDPLLLYFTSGTAARPKLVEHTQASYPVGHLSTMYWIGLQPGDVHLAISSPGWAKHAWSSFFAPWIAEAAIVVYNYSRFDALPMLEVLREEGVTSFCAPPTVWRMLIQADLTGGPGELREVVSAGEPLNAEVISKVREKWRLTIRDGYGQTELTAVVGNTPGSHVSDGSMGRPLPGCPVVLVNPVTGKAADEGEICIDLSQHPVNIMTGYLGDTERNSEAMRGGFYHTGDVASRDAEGYITYVGRADDVFKVSDYKISPFELESVLIEHPAVVEAAVVPAPDLIRLAVAKAYVTLAEGWVADEETAKEIFRHTRARLASYQRIRRIEFGDLPKTISGKIRRIELRERELLIANGEATAMEWRDE